MVEIGDSLYLFRRDCLVLQEPVAHSRVKGIIRARCIEGEVLKTLLSMMYHDLIVHRLALRGVEFKCCESGLRTYRSSLI